MAWETMVLQAGNVAQAGNVELQGHQTLNVWSTITVHWDSSVGMKITRYCPKINT
jgi:hypothetical protein